MNTSPSSPTLAGFAGWLAASADALTEAAAKASAAGDPRRGRQIHNLAQFLRPIGTACEVFASGKQPELFIADEAPAERSDAAPAAPAAPAPEATQKVSEALARFHRELAELNAGDAVLKAELHAIGQRVIAHGEAKRSVIARMTAELTAIRGGTPV